MDGHAWAKLALVTPPTEPVLALADLKAQCRVDHDDDDALLTTLAAAAQAHIEGPYGAGIALLTQQWRLSVDKWPWGAIIVPLGPVQSIDQITYEDLAYNPNTLDPAMYVYDLDASPVRIRRAFGVVWPIIAIKPGAAKVTFTCGYGAAPAAAPADLIHAMKLLVSHWYEHRDGVVGVENRDSSTIMPLGVDAILDRYRVGRVA